MTAEVGKRYRLRANVGNEEGGLHLLEGTEATVLEIVPEEQGVHDGGVVVQLPDRNWGCPLPNFDNLFEEVTE